MIKRYTLFEGNADIAVTDDGMSFEYWAMDPELGAFDNFPVYHHFVDIPPLATSSPPTTVSKRCTCGRFQDALPPSGICPCGYMAIV
ncbi:hypothetical protein DYB36_009479 [Aphanomyces astaci]|uniref:Uncharacterized protein n=1 Tax=Aphanomyces astaci TaxID=112090 RepID=A0A397AGR1_APHAT|nr:hypothetical protein DYB36_009479 [Aphanomyces astaci]